MKFEASAGGVVFKKVDKRYIVLVAQHAQHHGWVFPKGLIGDREDNRHQSKEETAVREVEEETGVAGRILRDLTPVEYWYQWENEKRKKTVYYFVMEHVSEDPGVKDDEMEKVEWLSEEDVMERLTYPADKKVWKEARVIIEELNKS